MNLQMAFTNQHATIPERKVLDGKVTMLDGEVAFLKNGYFHRIEGPARYMPDGRHLHYINGNDVTGEIEDMYADGTVVWVDESNYKYPDKDVMDEQSKFTVELAFGGLPLGKHACDIWDAEWAVDNANELNKFNDELSLRVLKGMTWKEALDSLTL